MRYPKGSLPPAASANAKYDGSCVIENHKEIVNGEGCLPGKNLLEKLHTEMEDIESGNKAQ